MLLNEVVAVAADSASVALEPLKRGVIAGAGIPVTVERALHRVPLPVLNEIADVREQASENGDYAGFGGVTRSGGADTRKGRAGLSSPEPITTSPPSA